MGNEYQIATERSRAVDAGVEQKQSNAVDVAAPGKQTLSSTVPPSYDTDAMLLSMKTTTIVDGQYRWAIIDGPAFQLLHAPDGKGENTTIIHRGERGWSTLVGLAMKLFTSVQPRAATSSSTPQPIAAPPAPPAPMPAPAAATTATPTAAAATSAAGEDPAALDAARDAALANAKSFNDGTWAHTLERSGGKAAIADETVKPRAKGDVGFWNYQGNTTPSKLWEQASYRTSKGQLDDQTWIRIKDMSGNFWLVESLAGPDATEGTELGWTQTSQRFNYLPRAPRPSSPGAQMAAIYAVAKARATTSHGRCWPAIKNAIVLAGGYGDLLDVNNDPRLPVSAVKNGPSFDAAVAAYGPEKLGLERSTSVAALLAAPRGALVITIGNDNPAVHISKDDGDIAVFDGIENHTLFVYNDGHTPFTGGDKVEAWGTSGPFRNMFVAMYVPIARK